MNYKIFNKHIFDINKKTIFVFLLDGTLKYPINIGYKYIFNSLDILKKHFNIIILTSNSGTKWLDNFINLDYMYLIFDLNKKYHKSNKQEMPFDEKINYIIYSIKEFINNDKTIFNSFIGCISSQIVIPALNTDFEIISSDNKLIKKRNKSVNSFIEKIKNHKLISHNAFIHKPLGFPLEFLTYLMKNYPNKYYYYFCHDTSTAWPLFDEYINPYTKNVKIYYFVNDNRSNRHFKSCILNQLQDFYNKKNTYNYEYILNNKSYDFIFGGLFPFDVDYRINDYYNYFNNLKNNNSIIRTQVNGKSSISNKTFIQEKQSIKNKKNINEKLIDDILNNKLIKHTLNYDDYNNELQQTMFTLILKCYYGKYDSLNFRFINSIYFGTIPLIDYQYDIDNLQIPKYFKDKLIVKNHIDIENKIQYYKNNYNEYKKLFFELYNYFIKPEYFTINFYINEFKNKYFKEIY